MSIFQKLTTLPDTNVGNQANDCAKRYDGTVMLLSNWPGLAQPEPVFLRIRGSAIQCAISTQLITLDGTQDQATLTPILPAVGYYSANGVLGFLTKNPQRQWKRSLCSGIYRFKSPNKDTQTGTTDNYAAIARATLNPEYVNLDALVHPLFTNVPISRLFAITGHKGKNWLVYRCCPVGELNYTDGTIILKHSILEQEVKDLMQRTGVKKWKLKTM